MIVYEENPQTKTIGVQFLMDPRDYTNKVKLQKLFPGTPYVVLADEEGPLLEFIDCYMYDAKKGAAFVQSLFDERVRKMWRKKRAEKFRELDTRYIIALERKDESQLGEIVRMKNILRDITRRAIPPFEPQAGVSVRNYIRETLMHLPEELS